MIIPIIRGISNIFDELGSRQDGFNYIFRISQYCSVIFRAGALASCSHLKRGKLRLKELM